MDERAAALHLERLRKHRNRKPRDLSPPVGEQVARLKTVRRRSSGGERVILDLLPSKLRSLISSIRITNRTIQITTRDDGARYVLDRWFRGVGREGVLAAVGARDIRLVVAGGFTP